MNQKKVPGWRKAVKIHSILIIILMIIFIFIMINNILKEKKENYQNLHRRVSELEINLKNFIK